MVTSEWKDGIMAEERPIREVVADALRQKAKNTEDPRDAAALVQRADQIQGVDDSGDATKTT